MKLRILIITAVIFALAAVPASARVWQVDNNATILNAGEFATLQDAQDAAANGDTLYVYGSSTEYVSFTLIKKLYIFGPGYYLDQNPDTSTRPVSATIKVLIFDVGSEGSLVSGIAVNGEVTINTDDITCKRIWVQRSISTADGVSNVIISQNFINSSISIGKNTNNILISNNYIGSSIPSSSSIIILIHNVIGSTITCSNSVLDNNILRGGSLSGTGNSYRNNIGNSTQFGTEDGNQSNVDMSTVFVVEGSGDGKWQLVRNSSAIGAGTGGTDIGMFGGSDPYVLSGLPEIPLIYYFTGSATGTETLGLDIHLKAKTMK